MKRKVIEYAEKMYDSDSSWIDFIEGKLIEQPDRLSEFEEAEFPELDEPLPETWYNDTANWDRAVKWYADKHDREGDPLREDFWEWCLETAEMEYLEAEESQ